MPGKAKVQQPAGPDVAATVRATDSCFLQGRGIGKSFFADGAQTITGCAFSKGNIKKLHHGKWGLAVVDKKSGRAVRVVPHREIP